MGKDLDKVLAYMDALYGMASSLYEKEINVFFTFTRSPYNAFAIPSMV